MTHGSLFSGIGGFDLASEWIGWTNVFHVEKNEFCNKILNYYWPDAKSYTDIKFTDFNIWRGAIDIVTGGFPCQPFSGAGKRKGKDDDRYLWPEMLRAIRQIQPGYVVGENVSGFTNWNRGVVFDEVQADLEAEGYQVLPFLLPACAVNAPHRRDRIWFIAHNNVILGGSQGRETVFDNSERQTGQHEQKGRTVRNRYSSISEGGTTSNSKSIRERSGSKEQGKNKTDREQLEGAESWCNGNNNGKGGIIADTDATRKWWNEWKEKGKGNIWEQFPTQSPLCGGDDGLPGELDGITLSKHRNESLKGYGNAIVPQVAYEIFKSIEQLNRCMK